MGNVTEGFNSKKVELKKKNSEIVRFPDFYEINDKIFENSIDFYLGNLNDKSKMNSRFYIKHSFPDIFYLIDKSILHQNFENNYFIEMKKYYTQFLENNVTISEPKFLFLPGDVKSNFDIPVITKTRPVANNGLNILLPFNIIRHWTPVEIVEKYDIPFQNKESVAIWRGVSTGGLKRHILVEKYFDYDGNIDVGYTKYTDDYGFKHFPTKEIIPIEDQLKYKYIISVEGNDVASNLKWILSSQSVCIKPVATINSWLMEGCLVPFVHYVPVRHDFEDLPDAIEWCENHPEICLQIIKAANDYMNRFKTPQIEKVLEVMDIYNKKVVFV